MSSSKKWTPFPCELNEQIISIFTENFSNRIGDGQFVIDGRIYSEELLFRVGFQPKKRLHQTNFEASIHYTAFENIQDAIDLCLDATGSMMEQYYQANGRLDLPQHWEEFVFDKQKLYLQFSSLNTSIEAEADKLLGVSQAQLVHEEDPSEDLYNQPDDIEGSETTGEGGGPESDEA
jgi:hypothetical protein